MNDPVAELAGMIEEVSGFLIEPRSFAALAAVAAEQVASLRLAGLEEYMDLLSLRSDSPEWRRLLSRITVKESFLFRGRAQFAALSDTVLREFAASGRGPQLRVWCAGCARGEEAVTLAIVLAEHPQVSRWDWSILATDVDAEAVEEARTGRYGPRAVAAVPGEILDAYFVQHGGFFDVDPELMRRIEYRRLNLAGRDPGRGDGPFDLVFLRNVLIYFRPDLQRRVVQSVEQSLAPHGVLFLGPSESLLPLEARLRPRDLGGCFCYCRPESMPSIPEGGEFREAAGPATIGEPLLVRPPLPPETGLDEVRIDERIRAAVTECSTGDPETALETAGRLRNLAPENPLVHVLVGMAARRSGNHEAAMLAFRAAHYLDSAIPEIRYLLAEAFEACGRAAAARREYRATLATLNAAERAAVPEFKVLGLPSRDDMILICRKKNI